MDLWDAIPFSLVDKYKCFGKICCLQLQDKYMKKEITKITSEFVMLCCTEHSNKVMYTEDFFFPVALWPNAGHGLLILEVHTRWRTTAGRTPLDEWSAHHRDLYLTIHNIHNRQTSMLPVRFKPTISAGERPQTYALDCPGHWDWHTRKITPKNMWNSCLVIAK